jgi:tetratricopeptide (TPR) repeat protein
MKIRARTIVPLALLLAATSPTWQGDGSFSLFSSAYAQDDEDREAKEDGRRVLRARDVTEVNLSEEYRKLARQKRHESMRFLKEILSQGTAQGEQKAEMILRLADLYFEEGRDIYLDEMKKYEEVFDACFNDERCDTMSVHQEDYTAESRDWQGKSIKLYRQILANYPQYQRADEATFYLASALLDTDQADAAVKEFTRLVRTYPESKWVPDAYVLIGEYYFEKNNAYKALVAYQKAATYRDSSKYAFALYKLAWCYYNVGEYGKGIDTMKTVVAHAMSTSETNSRSNKIQLQDEALKDLVRFFADAGEMDEAYAYFNKLGKKELIRSMLKRLATTYFEQGKFEQCVQTYRRLIAEDPQSENAPDYQNEIVGAYLKMGKKQETVAEIDRLLKTYGKNSAWARANASNPDALKTAAGYIEKNLRKVAINYHDEAKKLGKGAAARESYALAYKAYSVYLSEFPDSQYSYDVRYAFGELLYKIKKYDEAYSQYMKVVDIDKKGKHSEFCSESAIFAADEMIKREKKAGGSAPNPGKATEAIELTEWEGKLLAALDQYSTLFPASDKTKNIIYKSAYLLYNKNHFKEASDRFRVVIGMDPSSKEAEQAANLILDSFALVEDWKNLKDVSKAFYDQDGLGRQAFKQEVFNIYERASFKLIEVTFEKSQDKAVAASDYRAFYDEFPESEVADLSLNNAAVYFHGEGNLAKAMETRHLLVDNFPKSDFYKDQVAALGFDYESIADFSNAAMWYEKLFTLDAEHESAPDALYSSALFRRAMGEWQVAIKNYEKYISAYPDKENVEEIKLEIAKIYESNEKWSEASKIYQRFYKDAGSETPVAQVFYARLRYGMALSAMEQTSALDKHWADCVREISKIPEGTELGDGVEVIAQILYEVAEAEYTKYAAKAIDGPGSQKLGRKATDKLLLKQLTEKAQSLQAMELTYANIINTGAGEWGVAALVRVGQAYENMGAALENSYIPSYLSADQVEFYKMALEDKIYPQEEKAVESYKLALEKSFELSLYNENTAYAIRRLGDLRPDDYPGLEEGLLDPGYVSTRSFSADFETEL